jgi:hypothetical protein
MIVSMHPEAIFTFISPFSLAILDIFDAVEKAIALVSDDIEFGLMKQELR